MFGYHSPLISGGVLDAPAIRWRDTRGEGELSETLFYLQDFRGDITGLSDGVGVVERTRYGLTGRPTAYPAADVNFDGVVDSADLKNFSDTLQAMDPSKEKYDPRLDLNMDGEIDGDDESLFNDSYQRFEGPWNGWKLSSQKSPVMRQDEDAADVGYDNRFGWRGYIYDPVLQKYHVRHRVYDPREGRWMQTDPLGFGAGDDNLYRYCDGNYTTGYDPLGLYPPDSPSWDRLAERATYFRQIDDPGQRFLDRLAMNVTVSIALLPVIPLAGAGVAAATGSAAAGTVTTGVLGGGVAAVGGYQTGQALYAVTTGEDPGTFVRLDSGQRAEAAADALVGLVGIGVMFGAAGHARYIRTSTPELLRTPEGVAEPTPGRPTPAQAAPEPAAPGQACGSGPLASIKTGDTIVRSYQTPAGTVQVLAEVTVQNGTVTMEVAVYPSGASSIPAGYRNMAAIRNAIAAEAKDAGFTTLRIIGNRFSGANPGRGVDVTIPLNGAK